MLFCPFCGSRQEIDLRKVQFRDLGGDASLPCPDCLKPLNVIEIATDPAMTIERCPNCVGMFFNPGELEKLIEDQTHDFVWTDQERLEGIAGNHGYHHEVIYLQCPICRERMSHRNFGGSSGVIIDRCGTHGVWVQGGELRRIMEWWAAGGKHLHQQHEQERIARLNALKLPPSRGHGTHAGTFDPAPASADSGFEAIELIGTVVIGLLEALSD